MSLSLTSSINPFPAPNVSLANPIEPLPASDNSTKIPSPTNPVTSLVPTPNRSFIHRKVNLNTSGVKDYFTDQTFDKTKLNLRNGAKSKNGFIDEKGQKRDSWYGDIDYNFGTKEQPLVGPAAFQWAKIRCEEGMRVNYDPKTKKWERQIMGYITLQDIEPHQAERAKSNLNGYLSYYQAHCEQLEVKQSTFGMEHFSAANPQATLPLGIYLDKEAKENMKQGKEVVAERPPRRYFIVVENDFTVGTTTFTLPDGTFVPWSVLEKKGFEMYPVEVFCSQAYTGKAKIRTAIRSAVITKWFPKKETGVNQQEIMSEYSQFSEELRREMEEELLNSPEQRTEVPPDASDVGEYDPLADDNKKPSSGLLNQVANMSLVPKNPSNQMANMSLTSSAPPTSAIQGNFAIPTTQASSQQPFQQGNSFPQPQQGNPLPQQQTSNGYALPSQTMPQAYAGGQVSQAYPAPQSYGQGYPMPQTPAFPQTQVYAYQPQYPQQ